MDKTFMMKFADGTSYDVHGIWASFIFYAFIFFCIYGGVSFVVDAFNQIRK